MKELYTVPEAARKLRISARTLYELIRSKQVRCRKVGGSIRLTPNDLQAALVPHPVKSRKPLVACRRAEGGR